MNNVFYIYAHFTKDTNELFYLGKGSGKRWQHKTRRNKYWKNVVNKHGYYNEFLYSNLNELEALKIEKDLIALIRPKCNLSTGGEIGITGYKKTTEQKKTARLAQLKSKKHKRQKIECITTSISFYSISEASRFYNVHKFAIYNSANSGKAVKGLIFKFVG